MYLRLLFTFCLLIGVRASFLPYAMSQGLCDRGGGGFSLDKTEGCAPLTVTITNEVANSFADGYVVGYNGVSTTNVAFIDGLSSFTYTSAGVYTLLQKVVTATGQYYACKTVTVAENRGIWATYTSCGGSKVVLTLIDNVILQAYDWVEVDWGDGQSLTWNKGDDLTLEYTYKDTSVKPSIRIIGHYNAGKSCDKGLASVLPVVFQQAQLQDITIHSIEMKGGGSVEIDYMGLTGVYTDLKYSSDGGATYTTAATRSGGGTQIARINGLNPAQIYQVKLGSRDLCGGVLDSDVITSMVLNGSTANETNILTWNEYPSGQSFESYELFRDGISIQTFTDIKETTFTDENVECGDNFEYQIVTKTTNISSISAPISVKTVVNTPGSIEQASVTVDADDLITIDVDVPGASGKSNYEIIIEKADAGSTTFKRLATLYNETSYNDPDVKANEQSYCYKVSYRNACGQTSAESDPFCSIHLSFDQPLLRWTTENPFLDALDTYSLNQSSAAGSSDFALNQANNYLPKFNTQSDLEYNFQVTASSANGNFISKSNLLSLNRNINVYLPSAFTPDGDGDNEVFRAYGTLIKDFSLTIFNKWGQVIYFSEDSNEGWDGTIKGAEAPVGAYVYKVKVVDIIGQEVFKSGTFMLLR
ncbi:gliding motility-associated-like protein [Dyadobacter jejuensis]|uniref:Gliding motility-associated-like protein n=1 Tax=Dyadobacter jejuensis TaxID=1082580 RepID=A0A316AR78_9BACT|nr:gliding motility-associated C-terminal domain-containing protein [Dyadobacter jejuensis]PWJ60243.1 gliding motility-associated-like protein [Dyadobacter jejuensis]